MKQKRWFLCLLLFVIPFSLIFFACHKEEIKVMNHDEISDKEDKNSPAEEKSSKNKKKKSSKPN